MLITDYILLNYKRCQRRIFLEFYGDKQQRSPEKEFLTKLKRENQTHIRQVIQNRWLDSDTEEESNYQTPTAKRKDWELNSAQTVELMERGAEFILGGSLRVNLDRWQMDESEATTGDRLDEQFLSEFADLTFLATPTILIKQPGKSKFGDWQYFPVNIKLGRRAKPEYKLIAAFHARMLGIIQEQVPERSQLILREQNDYYVRLDIWLDKITEFVAECLISLAKKAEPEVFISRQRCNLCSWHNYCYQVAKAETHLSLVPGITPRRYEELQKIDVNSFQSLLDVSETQLAEIIEPDLARQLKQQAIALNSDLPLVRANFDLVNTQPIPTGVFEIYFDIEAEPERQIDYLLGVVLVDRTNGKETFHAFFAEKPEDEAKIWQDFVDFLACYPDAPIFHYSEYELDTIKRLGTLYNTPKSIVKEIVSRLVDLHYWVMESTIFPVESYSLKAIANWIGFYWRDPGASGDLAVCWYDRWLTAPDRALLDLIFSYNEDDCRATRYLKDWLLDFLEYQRNYLLTK